MDSYGAAKAVTEDVRSQLPGYTSTTDEFTCDNLKAGFDNLANAARADQVTIGKLVKSNAVLTKTNEDLVSEVKKLSNYIAHLNMQNNRLRKRVEKRQHWEMH